MVDGINTARDAEKKLYGTARFKVGFMLWLCFWARVKNEIGKKIFFVFIFILLSRESDGGVVLWMNPHPLVGVIQFSSFPIVA